MGEITSRKKILIIDDDASFVRPTQISLEERGFEVVTAPNGVLGRAVAREIRPDLIILDVMMPGEHGLTALDKIKNDPLLSGTPVIMLTNLEKALPMVRGKTEAFVLKSDISMDQLVQKVVELVKKD